MECLLPYLCMVTVPHIMVGLERMMDYRDVGLERFLCSTDLVGTNRIFLSSITKPIFFPRHLYI